MSASPTCSMIWLFYYLYWKNCKCKNMISSVLPFWSLKPVTVALVSMIATMDSNAANTHQFMDYSRLL